MDNMLQMNISNTVVTDIIVEPVHAYEALICNVYIMCLMFIKYLR